MADEMNNGPESVSRRDFVAMTVAAGLAAASPELAAQARVMEMNVQIKTADGT